MTILDKEIHKIQKASKLLAYLKNERKGLENDSISTEEIDDLIYYWEEKLAWMNRNFQVLCDGISSVHIPEGREDAI